MHQPSNHSRSTVGPLLRLAWPVLAGHYLEEQHLAAMTMMAYVLWLLNNLFTIVSIGALALTARAIGAGDRLLANRVLNQAYLSRHVDCFWL